MNSPNKTAATPAPTLASQLLTDDRIEAITTGCTRMIEARIRAAAGLKGAALRAGFGMLESARPGIVARATRQLLPDFIGTLEPFYADYRTNHCADENHAGFGTSLKARQDAVAQALMTVADDRAAHSQNTTFRGFYGKLHGTIEREITAAVPAIADALDRGLRRADA